MTYEKAKLNYDILNTEEEVTLKGKNGDMITVRKRILYEDKEKMAFEMAALTQILNEGEGVCYRTYQQHLLDSYLIAKYYTNIDTDGMTEEEYAKLFDYLVYNDLYAALMEAVEGDYMQFVYNIAYRLITAAMERFGKTNSLEYKVGKTFGFLFTGEDLTDQIANAENVTGKLIDMFEAVRERDEKNALLKSSKAKVKSGSAVLNMAKK